MRRSLGKGPKDQGLTLVELAVAVLILSLGSVAALRTADQARLSIGGAQDRLMAQIAARNRIEELRLLGPNATLPEDVKIGHHTLRVESSSKVTAAGLSQTTVRAISANGPGAVFVTFLPSRIGQ